ncbi:MAG: PQQ-binding-like beta-propeller repeat protein, partial [Pirellulaceae bacterium]|nr:PQQ-binding-like beta-propeller repeat protein [Pirellulaceae bacterium]
MFRLAALLIFLCPLTAAAEDWLQYKFDARHSGDASGRRVETKTLGLLAAVPLTDGVYTSPVVADGKIYVVDGAGVASCIDAKTHDVDWRIRTAGGLDNCNNVSSPAVVGAHLHFGTTAGFYYVLERTTGKVVRKIDCRDPIFSTPVVDGDRVYFVTLGSQVFSISEDGEIAWQWDFLKEVIGFEGNRWNGQEWHQYKEGRVNWRDHFVCSRNLAAHEKTIVIPAGGRIVFLHDEGDKPRLRKLANIPSFHGSEFPAAFGLSLGADGAAYVQWHRRDNAGRVEVLRLSDKDELSTAIVPGTETYIDTPGLLSFSSVSLQGDTVYRVRPEQGFGLCRHSETDKGAQPLAPHAAICPPIVTDRQVIYGGLEGKLHVVDLNDGGGEWSFATPFGSPITAPAAVCDGRIYVGGEDGYLYVLGPGGAARPPRKPLNLTTVRSALTGKYTDPQFNWYTNYGNMGCTNANEQGIKPPLRMRWVRRVEGTVKHIPVCGGGRMYTHTAEGQVIAVEQETGRLLWRRYWPDVYLSFTSPLYYEGRLLVPQAGVKQSMMRCLDAATGELIWEAPFTGSPSWSRQFPPVLHGNLAIYASGSGRYAPSGTEKAFAWRNLLKRNDDKEVMSFIYSHNNPFYPQDNRPLIWAWDLSTGKVVWKKDFSEYGSGGNDCGVAMMDGKLYYSTFFGYQAEKRRRRGIKEGINGLTAALDPQTGDVEWMTTDHYVTAGCTVTAKDGR